MYCAGRGGFGAYYGGVDGCKGECIECWRSVWVLTAEYRVGEPGETVHAAVSSSTDRQPVI